MKENNSLMYGIVGVLIGGGIVWLMVTNAVNNNSSGMMQMMGIRNQTNSSALTMKNSNIDRHFIEQMIPHHEDAIGMARVALQKAEHPEIKKLAQDIEKSQTEEIVQMKSWYKEWFGIEVSSENENDRNNGGVMGHTSGGMMGNDTDIESLDTASNFDKTFIEEMIPHHQMAVMMGNMLLSATTRPEMKKLAKNIISAQSKEINEMRKWYTVWGY